MTRSRHASGLSRLEAFLAAPERAPGTFSLLQLHGFLFAVACAPVDVPFEAVLPEIVRPRETPDPWRRLEAAGVLPAVRRLYDDSRRRAARSAPRLPPTCALRTEAVANLEEGSPISQWVAGFGYGHLWMKRLWDDRLPGEQDLEIGAALTVFLFFGSREMAEEIHARVPARSRGSLEAMAEKMMLRFRDALATYARIGRSLRRRGRPTIEVGVN